jgi:cation diffusion facilitator CzcD-associated flavoprotein CzcO
VAPPAEDYSIGTMTNDQLEPPRGIAEAVASAAPSPPGKIHEVVILGAGMSGLGMGIGLKRAGIDEFVILERSAGLGGTWWDNRYPGAHVDVPAPLYSFSFEPNPCWQRRFASAPEIQAYQAHCARRYGLTPHLRFGQRISEAAFDASTGLWSIGIEGGERLRARFFVCSTGPLSQPRLPELAGLDEFQGRVLHSARWDPEVRLEGQRVAVIGTGSSAAQLVAPIAARAAALHVFQRTANWVLPRLDRRYTALDRLLAARPVYAQAVRRAWYHVLEFFRSGFDEGTVARRFMLALAGWHLRRQVPDEALRARLRPPYPLGCKRLLYSNDYYPALTRPNVELVTEGIRGVTAHGIVTSDGRERPIDTLVCATGFDTVHLLSSLEVRGTGGRTLRQAWKDGPEAYHGLTVAGFPNLFLLLGPNTGTGHTSTLLFIEPQVDYVIACLQELRRSGRRWLDLRPEVLAAHNQALQARLQGSVWAQCRSWYRMESGKVVALFPGFTREYVESIAQPDFRDYRFG